MALMTLAQRIEFEIGKTPVSEVKELVLNHSKSANIDGLTDEYVNLEFLGLVDVGLQNLSGFPELKSLKTLDLSSNAISGGLDALIKCPNLEQLSLADNKIDSLETLTPLAKLSNLRSLDLCSCDVTSVENYRKAVFAVLPNIKYLDGLDEKMVAEPESDGHAGDCVNGDSEDDEESEEEFDDYGIEALQRSDLLDDEDEEDYAPDEDEADLEDDYDAEDDEEEEETANLSAAGVTSPRRPGTKRRREVDDGLASAPEAKKANDDDDE